MPVTCPRCGAENPAAARFCMSCANPLAAAEPVGAAGGGAGEAPKSMAAPASASSEPTKAPDTPPPPPPAGLPPQFRSLRSAQSSISPDDPEWRMSPAGPLPDPPKRRIWVWVLIGLGAVLLLCVVLTLIGSFVADPTLQQPAGQ